MKISIITVCHNQIFHTKRFVASLKRFTPQEPHEWQLISIDSGSNDGTLDFLKTHLKYDNPPAKTPLPWNVIPAADNIGWVKGINLGLQYVSEDTDIIIFCNNDIVFDRPGWLERLLAHFDNPTVGAVGPTSNYVAGRQKVEFNVPHIAEEETKTLIGLCYAVRKSIVDEIGGLDDSLSPQGIGGGDDHDFSIRIRRLGFRLVIARDVFVYHAGSRTFIERLGTDGYNAHWKACDKALAKKWGEIEVAQLFTAPMKLAIGLPLRSNHPHWKFSKSLLYLQKPQEWYTIELMRCMVDQARNLIVDFAKKGSMDYILFLDDDHILPSDLFFKLLSHNKDVVAALAFRRQPPFGPCLFNWETDSKTGNLMVRDRPDLIHKGLQKVDAVGFGAVLIKMAVFEKLGPPPWFKFSEVGEDLHFCDLCAQKGIDIFCDTNLEVPHLNDDAMEVTAQVFFEHHKAKAGAA